MNHFPQATNPVQPQLRVPYLLPRDFSLDDSLPFNTYPTRAGVQVSDIGQDLDQQAAFLQAWLFFGTLTEVLGTAGVSVGVGDFVEERDGEKVLTTERLPRYLWLWIAAECVPGWAIDSEHLPRVQECLATVSSVVNELARVPFSARVDGGESRPGHAVLLSVILLGELLGNVLSGVVFSIPKMKALAWEYSSFGNYLLQRAGWCLGELEMLGIFEPAVLFYVSSFNRHLLKRDHSRCSDKVCLANQIDESVYRTKHVVDACECDHVLAEDDGGRPVTEILNNGDIPVISFTRNKLLVESSRSMHYVALSHVWSDGLGNPHANSLPKCQLLRIQRLVNALCLADPSSPVPFWLDTLCVPLQAGARKTAIRRMARTYESAAKVLVLDESLSDPSARVPADEVLMRIRCTPWTQRLWTLQEGMLAAELYFQFRDEAISAESLLEKWYAENTPIKLGMKHFGRSHAHNSALETRIHRALASDADEFIKDETAMESCFDTLSRFPDCPNTLDHTLLYRLDTNHSAALHPMYFTGWSCFQKLRYRIGVGHPALPSVVNALSRRLSSKMEDEAVCVATILDIDPLQILSAGSHARRMKALLDSVDMFPPSLIFTDVPRLAIPGYAWAPESFMHPDADYQGLLRVGEPGRRTDDGLVVRNYFAYVFPEKKVPPGSGSFVVSAWEAYFNITHTRPVASEVVRPVVILEQPPANVSRGALVDLQRDEGGVKYTRRVGTVRVEGLGDVWDGEVFCQVDKLPISQRWCVG